MAEYSLSGAGQFKDGPMEAMLTDVKVYDLGIKPTKDNYKFLPTYNEKGYIVYRLYWDLDLCDWIIDDEG